MLTRIVSRLTYANVVSTLAVVLLMGGVSYAATVLAPHSVGTRELKKNAVTSAQVKNGSLKAADFAGGQLSAGIPGSQGPQGTSGAPGAPGAPGATDSGDLSSPSSDLPTGWKAVITVSGSQLGPANTAFRVTCAATCSVAVAAAESSNRDYNSWYLEAQQHPAQAKKDFTLTVTNTSGVAVEQYLVQGALPSTYVDNGQRVVLAVDAELVQELPH